MTSPSGKPATIAQKARRKISLPWFRQGSVAPPHPALSRQHTIDTPSSFQARLLRRQPSQVQIINMSSTHQSFIDNKITLFCHLLYTQCHLHLIVIFFLYINLIMLLFSKISFVKFWVEKKSF